MSITKAGSRVDARVLLGVLAVVALIALVVRSLAYDDPRPSTAAPAARTLPDRMASLEQDVAADPDDADAWQRLAVVYTQLAAADGDPAYYGLAQDAVARAQGLAPDAVGTLVAQGNLELSLHRFSDALATGERLAGLAPASGEALAVLVDAQVEQGDYEAAATTLQDMLDVDPGVAALARTSYLRELSGDLAGAVTAMQQAEVAAVGSPADAASVGALLGDLYRQQGRLDAATTAYGKALDSAPGLVAAEVGLARVVALQDGPAAGLERARSLVERVPSLPAVQAVAELATAAGDEAAAAEALELARTLTTLQRDAGQVVDLELALLEADLGDPAAAVELARQAHAARPDNVYAADALAWSLFRAGEVAEAREHLDDALRLGSVDPSVRLHAAFVTAASDDADRARDHLEVALADPSAGFALVDDARALATSLDVPVPDAWQVP